MPRIARALGCFFGFMLLAIAGCSSAIKEIPETKRTDLMQLSELYENYSKVNQKPPAKLADLANPTYEHQFAAPVRALKNKEYLVVWGTPMGDGATVLAYEKDAPQSGGWVLFADGQVKQMSAADLGQKVKTK